MAVGMPPAGWTRLVVRSRGRAGRDLAALDPVTDHLRFFIDGKTGARPRAEVRDGIDLRYSVWGRLFGIPKRMVITDADDGEIASLRAVSLAGVRDRTTLHVLAGADWTLEGALAGRNYQVSALGQSIVVVTAPRHPGWDGCTIDLADGIDPALVLAMAWAVQQWADRLTAVAG